MKKTVLLLLTFFSFSIHSQIPKEAFDLTNSLSDLWKKENSKEAIKASKELNKIFQPFFIENIHNTLAQTIHRNNGNGNESLFLNQLYNQNQVSINKIIEPIYLWNKSLKINKQAEANSLLIKYYKKLSNSTNYKSKTELYAFLIIKGFDKKKLGNTKLKNKILTKISFNISSNQLINSTKEKSRKNSEERAHYRFLLAYYYNTLFNKNKIEKLIKNASKYSPDKSDLKNMSGFFYDAHILINGPHNINYKKKYFTYLIKNGKGEHAESILLERAYIQPTDENLKDLKDFYSIKTANKPFDFFWNNYLNSKMKKVPEINLKFQSETLNLIEKRNNWIYIDIWGGELGVNLVLKNFLNLIF
ncbi:hypothetical protein [Tenacibaculum halocynthiae]|uniref:hypothetical protein n=1 Tax=Tenacibaculum halocynthiae TaxID=1254437 RepID=UPI003894CBE2